LTMPSDNVRSSASSTEPSMPIKTSEAAMLLQSPPSSTHPQPQKVTTTDTQTTENVDNDATKN
jgi:hypothetical protein